MRRVAGLATAFALAATVIVSAGAEPANRNATGTETPSTRHDEWLELFNALHWSRWPRAQDLIPPPPGQDKAPEFDLLGIFQLPRGLRLDELPPPLGPGKPQGQVAPEASDSDKKRKFLYFTGGDLWANWAFAHAGILWSPKGLDDDGFTLKLLTSGGAYRYQSSALNNRTVIGRQYQVSAMPGLRFHRDGFELTLFAGLDYQQFRFYPVDPGTQLRRSHVGIRTTVELWHEPSNTTMLAADASLSTVGAGNHARFAFGWRAFDLLYLGPEMQVYTSENYRHTRVGMHLTAYKHRDREWSAGIGIAEDSDNRSGLYVRLGYLQRR